LAAHRGWCPPPAHAAPVRALGGGFEFFGVSAGVRNRAGVNPSPLGEGQG
jgi:hypothetical protein